MAQYLDLEGLKEFKKQADENYKPIKGTIPLTDKINLTTETKASLALKYAKVTNNTVNFYIIADSSNNIPSEETRININPDITSLVGAEGANVGDMFVIGKLNMLPVYRIIPLNDAKAANTDFKGTQGIVTPWDKTQINKIPSLESAISAAKASLPTLTESNMNNALQTGFYPWCTLGRPAGSTGAYTLVTLASSTADSAGYTTIEQTAYGRQNDDLGKIFKRIIFKPSSGDAEYGEWKEITGGGNEKNSYIQTEIFRGHGDSNNNSIYLQVPDKLFGCGILDIRGIIPCFIQKKGDASEPNIRYCLPLSALGYYINYAYKIADRLDEGDPTIELKINNSIVYNDKECTCTVSDGAFYYIEIDYYYQYALNP